MEDEEANRRLKNEVDKVAAEVVEISKTSEVEREETHRNVCQDIGVIIDHKNLVSS